MGDTETLAALGTQDTGRRQSRDTGNIGCTRHKTKTIQRHWQHWVHKTQAEDNPETLATLGTQDTRRRQSSDTSNIGCTRHKTKTNKSKNTTQKTTKDEQHGHYQELGGGSTCSRILLRFVI